MTMASVLLASFLLVIRARTTHAFATARKWTMSDNRSFRTEVHIPVWPEHCRVDYASSFFLLGSCFSDHISRRLERAKLPTSLNPSHGARSPVRIGGKGGGSVAFLQAVGVKSVGILLVGSTQSRGRYRSHEWLPSFEAFVSLEVCARVCMPRSSF